MRRRGQQRLLDHGFRQVSGEAYTRTDSNVFMQTTFGGGGDALNTALGFGPSAIGFTDGTLYQNVADLNAYFEAVESGRAPLRASERMSLTTARRRALMFGLQRLDVPRAALQPREERAFAAWERLGLVEGRDAGFRLTPGGAAWYNQMQLALLPLSEQRRLTGLLGTSRQQAQALANRSEDAADPTEQLLALIRGEGGPMASVRVWGYKSLLMVKRFPGLEDRALGFSGPLAPDRETSVDRGA
jgi:hypothetical protein